ncbi:uncharacterized protein BP5553_10319 [Venustampulla echinocandica]|uniref:Uncharacterized protein n=1 Tax=Venustampulla echinocandica TaxID=2656787 RepID=A0A370T9Y3_9HELO|nr:uncharacterized protein BP5553_10319 [Venustampulla echinocandica]RDL30441.1 hypothetical protein BP5553_10319 [Venustampulla echinocandica]
MSSREEQASQLARVDAILGQEQGEIGKLQDKVVSDQGFLYGNWAELLSAAPLSLTAIGNCFIAASSPLASSINLKEPNGGFKFLGQTSLRAGLVQTSDAGTFAFLNAQARFDTITLISGKMFETVERIVMLLNDPGSAKVLLRPTMQRLKKGADECAASARDMDGDFEKWLQLISELHIATVQGTTDVDEKILTNQIALAMDIAIEGKTKEVAETAKVMVDKITGELDTARELYKKAVKSMPSGWEMIAQSFVSQLANTMNSTIRTALPAMLSVTGASAVSAAGMNIFGNEAGQDTSAHAGPNFEALIRPKDSDDPAYTRIHTTVDFVRGLKSILTSGEDGGVDWSHVTVTDSSDKGGLTYVLGMLDVAERTFPPSESEPSRSYMEIVQTSIRIGKELQAEGRKSTEISWKAPEKNSPQVVGWQSEMLKIFSFAVSLDSTAKTIFGIPERPNQPVSTSQSGNAAGSNATVASQIIDAHVTLVTQTQTVYLDTQKQYVETQKYLIQIQTEVAKIAGEMAKLQAESVSLEEIKSILSKSIDCLTTMKIQVAKLVTFFDGIAGLVDFAIEHEVIPFIDDLNAFTGDEKEVLITGYTFSDLSRQIISTMAMTMRFYFSIFMDVGKMYGEVSRKHIMPGVELCNQLGVPSNIDAKMRALFEFTKNSQEGVNRIVQAKQDEILDNIKPRALEAARNVEFLPPSVEVRAIVESGARVVSDAAIKGLESHKSLIIRPFGSLAQVI